MNLLSSSELITVGLIPVISPTIPMSTVSGSWPLFLIVTIIFRARMRPPSLPQSPTAMPPCWLMRLTISLLILPTSTISTMSMVSAAVVEMALVGKINKEIVNLINQHGGMAVGLCGKDGGLIRARKMMVTIKNNGQEPETVDIGMVGEITGINPTVINSLDDNKFIPVIAPIGVGDSGETYNINADLVAGQLAEALGAEKLILLTDVEGVKDKKGELLSTLKINQARKLIQDGVVGEGMIPKVECCIEALKGGVGKTHIIDGRVKHAVLLEAFTKEGVGTEVVQK